MTEARVHVSPLGYAPMAMRIDIGRHTLIGDEPAAYGGDDLGPTPFDLLAAALGECTAMWVGWHARRQGMPLERISVDVTHERQMVDGRPGKVDSFHRALHIVGDALTPAQRQDLLDRADGCPVHRALTSGSVVTTAVVEPGAAL